MIPPFIGIHDIVMEREKFLFSFVEQACFERLNTLSCKSMSIYDSGTCVYFTTYIIVLIDSARYLLIRLCLCKRGKWHTLSSLEERYKSEIGGKQHISDAIDELCGVNREASLQVKREDPNVIDLTLDEDDHHHGIKLGAPQDKVDQKGGNTVDSTSSIDENSIVFATDDSTASLPELLACLPNDELKAIGKQLKVARTGQNVRIVLLLYRLSTTYLRFMAQRSALMEAILSGASAQSTLVFPVLTPRRNSAKHGRISMHQLTLSFAGDGKMKTQISIVRQLVSKVIGAWVSHLATWGR